LLFVSFYFLLAGRFLEFFCGFFLAADYFFERLKVEEQNKDKKKKENKKKKK
jgi:hypothetical protein